MALQRLNRPATRNNYIIRFTPTLWNGLCIHLLLISCLVAFFGLLITISHCLTHVVSEPPLNPHLSIPFLSPSLLSSMIPNLLRL
jgi:hypothetical protein